MDRWKRALWLLDEPSQQQLPHHRCLDCELSIPHRRTLQGRPSRNARVRLRRHLGPYLHIRPNDCRLAVRVNSSSPAMPRAPLRRQGVGGEFGAQQTLVEPHDAWCQPHATSRWQMNQVFPTNRARFRLTRGQPLRL